MKGEILKYVHLRVYKNLTNIELLNIMLCNRIMKVPLLVDNSRLLYNLSSKILGTNFTTFLINKTFCKALTAGNTLQEADKVSNYFRKLSKPLFISRYSSHSRLLCLRVIRTLVIRINSRCELEHVQTFSRNAKGSKKLDDFHKNYRSNRYETSKKNK